jgi:hypothetical protein
LIVVYISERYLYYFEYILAYFIILHNDRLERL